MLQTAKYCSVNPPQLHIQVVWTPAHPGTTITFTSSEDCLREKAEKLRSKVVNDIIAVGSGNLDLERQLAEKVTAVGAFVVPYKDRFTFLSTLKKNLRKVPDLDYPIRVDRVNGTGYTPS
ncbi:hypothetical protein HPB48_001385 [Haemaphysalis longicornis]|uniref:Uncharacterized protein n=1 Tax=Haemaphysalis longicornis TaxID=44386 RepID=A0A9J6FGG6_HAELO|nr:hypothetical protein HPB48_001385 [Haemaphysalis longicornis]